MMILQTTTIGGTASLVDALDRPAVLGTPVGASAPAETGLRMIDGRMRQSMRMMSAVNVSPNLRSVEGQDRLRGLVEGTTDISTGTHTHAAVRTHEMPVKGFFWAYCPNGKAGHSQRSRFAT